MKASQPFVSVIIPTHDRKKMLSECMSSLARIEYPLDRYEIIIINDGIPLKDSLFEKNTQNETRVSVKMVTLNRRVGLTKARNVGLKAAKGVIIAFIDDDVIVDKEWLGNLVKAYRFKGKIGGVGGRIISSFDELPNDANVPIGTFGWFRTFLNFNVNRRSKVDWIRGCNMSFYKSVVEEVGGFDESLGEFSHGEDGDICLRVRAAEYDLIYEPTALVVHRRAVSGGIRTPPIQLAYWEIRNSSYIFLKNFRMPKKIVAVTRVFFIVPILCTLEATRRGNIGFSFLCRILFHTIRGLIDGIMLNRSYARSKRECAGRTLMKDISSFERKTQVNEKSDA